MNTAECRIEGIFKADAQKCCDEIGENEVTKESILQIAKNPMSELHKCFEWDDNIAAEKYRLHQAENIIRNLVIKRKKSDSQPIRYYSITREKGIYIAQCADGLLVRDITASRKDHTTSGKVTIVMSVDRELIGVK